MKTTLFVIAFFLFALPSHALDIDVDNNNATDIEFGGTNANTAGAALTNLGAAASSHTHSGVYQPADADLTTYAGITPSANVQTLLGSADFAAMRTNLSLVPGTNVQAYDAELSAIAGLTFSDASIIQLTGAAAADVLTSGGAHYFLKSAADNASLLFASPEDSVSALFTFASQAEMEEGTVSDIRSMSPLRVAQAISALAVTGSGYIKDDGTVPLTADWNMGDFAITAKSFTAAKASGVAGDIGMYEANSTDVDTAGFIGAASMTGDTSYRMRLPAAGPTIAGSTLTLAGTAASGSGTPSNPYIFAGSFTPVVAKTDTVCIHVSVVKPQDMADAVRDKFIFWSNEGGASFTVTSWKGWAGTDDTTLAIKEYDADGASNVATVDAVELATGSGPYTGSDSTISAATIEDGHVLALDFDDTDDPSYVKMTICGHY